jgi:hypothetical protein
MPVDGKGQREYSMKITNQDDEQCNFAQDSD